MSTVYRRRVVNNRATAARVAGARGYGRFVPRRSRELVDGIYHVFARGSNRQALFELDVDRTDFLDGLRRVIVRYELGCLAYCLMTNHYHLLVHTRGPELSSAMRDLNGRYARRFNRRNERDAHLFRNRFGAVLQESDDQLLTTVRYIARNPIEKGLCARAEEWRWSGHRAVIGKEPSPSFLDVDELLAHFGDPAEMARSRYAALVDE